MAEYYVISSSPIYSGIQRTVASGQQFSRYDWPAAEITDKGVKASIDLCPMGGEGYLPPDERAALQEEMLGLLSRLDDSTVDVLDVVIGSWLDKARACGDFITITADEILDRRNLVRKLGGSKRRGGYHTKQRKQVEEQIKVLQNLRVRIRDLSVYEKTGVGSKKKLVRYTGESRLVLVDSWITRSENDSKESAQIMWKIRPGDTFSKLFLNRRETALISVKALEYHPRDRQWEKRLTRYLSWLWRCKAKDASYLEAITVEKILERLNKGVDRGRPHRTRERFEECLDRLHADGVIGGWQYEKDPEECTTKGWVPNWLQEKVLVEPPELIKTHYLTITSKVLSDKPGPAENPRLTKETLKSVRLERGLTQLQMAEYLGCSPSYLCLLESGTRKIARKIRDRVERFTKVGAS